MRRVMKAVLLALFSTGIFRLVNVMLDGNIHANSIQINFSFIVIFIILVLSILKYDDLVTIVKRKKILLIAIAIGIMIALAFEININLFEMNKILYMVLLLVNAIAVICLDKLSI